MLKNNSNVEYNNILIVKNIEVEEKLNHATRCFSNGQYATASALCKEALNLCNENSLDQALCYYRLAITNRSDKTYEENYFYLNHSLVILESYSDQNPGITLQIQKTLAHQAKVVLDIKDGNKLLLVTEKLLKSIEKQANKAYEVECYRYLYHIALAQCDIDKAKEYIKKAKTICIDDAIEIKHDIKMKFIDAINESKNNNKENIKIKIIKEVFTPYYNQVYSKRVDSFLKEKKAHLKTLIKKDLLFILDIKLFIEEPTMAIKSVINLAKKIFNDKEIEEIKKSLQLKKHLFNKDQKILLGFNLFPDKNPPFYTKEDVLYNDTSPLSSINMFEEKNIVLQKQLTGDTESYSFKPEWKR